MIFTIFLAAAKSATPCARSLAKVTRSLQNWRAVPFVTMVTLGCGEPGANKTHCSHCRDTHITALERVAGYTDRARTLLHL